jgi:hypothetical protein
MRSSIATLVLAATAATAHAADPSELTDEELDAALDAALAEPLPRIINPPPPVRDADGTYGRYTDVRLRYSHGSGSWGADLDAAHQDGTIERERGFRLDVVHSGGLRTRGGWFYGVGFEYVRAHGTLFTADAHRSLYTMQVMGGWAVPLGSRLQLELGMIDQLGYGSIRETFPGAGTPTLGGLAAAIGGEATLVYTDLSGWQLALGAGARYLDLRAKSPDMYEAKTTGTATAIGAFLGKRF